MLSHDQAEQIAALLAAGLSHRNIAVRMNVSRGTVSRVARFGPHQYVRRVAQRRPSPQPQRVEPWRCPSCGGKITTSECIKCGTTPGAKP